MSINGKSRGYTHIVHRTTHWISGINFLRQTFDSTGCCLSIRCVVSVGVCWIILICAGRALWIDWDWCGWWATVLLDAIFQRHRVRRAGKLDGCRTAVATDPRSLYAGDMERERACDADAERRRKLFARLPLRQRVDSSVGIHSLCDGVRWMRNRDGCVGHQLTIWARHFRIFEMSCQLAEKLGQCCCSVYDRRIGCDVARCGWSTCLQLLWVASNADVWISRARLWSFNSSFDSYSWQFCHTKCFIVLDIHVQFCVLNCLTGASHSPIVIESSQLSKRIAVNFAELLKLSMCHFDVRLQQQHPSSCTVCADALVQPSIRHATHAFNEPFENPRLDSIDSNNEHCIALHP